MRHAMRFAGFVQLGATLMWGAAVPATFHGARPIPLGLRDVAARYAALRHVPLSIVITLQAGTALGGHDPLQLDNLLARLIVDEHGGWATVRGDAAEDPPAGWELPVPLRILWRSPDGLPLTAATPFVPIGLQARDALYLHKRQQSGRWTHGGRAGFAPRAGSGRWAERRTPIPVTTGPRWVATCVGNPDEIVRLLARVSALGKKRALGLGVVQTFTVAPRATWHLVRGGVLTRTFPALALPTFLAHAIPQGDVALVGWTMPQWRASLFRPGWWVGTPCGDDPTLEVPC